MILATPPEFRSRGGVNKHELSAEKREEIPGQRGNAIYCFAAQGN